MKTLFDYLNRHQVAFAVAFTLLAAIATILKRLLEPISEMVLNKLREPISERVTRYFKPHSSEESLPSEEALPSDAPVSGVELLDSGRTNLHSPHQLARAYAVLRLNDAKAARRQEESSAKLSRILSGALTFAQVVIGGVLASSFVQESLPPKTVGVFGVLVLIASLVKQQYHPEVDAEQARQRASKLRILIRRSEDELATIDTRSARGKDRPDALIDLRNRISLGLTEIENLEAGASQLQETDRAQSEVEETT